MRKRHVRYCAAAVGTLATFHAQTSYAFNEPTHYEIANIAWQLMRASADPALLNTVFGATLPAGTFSFREPGPCLDGGSATPCQRNVTQAEWDAFLTAMANARQALNAIPTGINRTPNCSYTGQETLKDFPEPLTGEHKSFAQHAEPKCEKFDASSWHPDGIFNSVQGSPATDGSGFQGPLLGHLARSGDDHTEDAELTYEPVYGFLIDALAATWDIPNTLMFGPILCLIDLLSGGDCDLDDILADARRANPFTYIPGFTVRDAAYNGLWHFINGRSVASGSPAGTNSFDDRRGMLYSEAGPLGCPGTVDQAIHIATTIGHATLSADGSEGTRRYEIRAGNDGHRNSVPRTPPDWGKTLLGDTEFSPLDNFARYGEQRFEASRAAGTPTLVDLSWPLHAIGDACVPQHATGTTSWGHRPLEDWTQSNLHRLTFNVADAEGNVPCMAQQAGPTQPLSCTQASEARNKQFLQGHHILEHAFRYFSLLNANVSTRDFITLLATETVAANMDGPDEPGSLFCDWCSFDWTSGIESAGAAVGALGAAFCPEASPFESGTWETYYAGQEEKIRGVLERAIGATIAYLTSKGSPPVCAALGESCSGANSCCNGHLCTIDGVCSDQG